MLKLKPLIAAKAKENQRGGQGGVLLPQNSAKANVETRKELSKLAGIGSNTISRIEKIVAKAKENLTLSPGRGKKGPQNSANLITVARV